MAYARPRLPYFRRDENGEIYTVRYDAVNAMLLNEFLKEHCKVETGNDDQPAKFKGGPAAEAN